MKDREFWERTRAALIARAKALELERAAIRQQVSVIERMLGVDNMQTVNISPSDSIAGIISAEQK